jgi:hypothetical protein
MGTAYPVKPLVVANDQLRQALEIARDDRSKLGVRLVDRRARPEPGDHRAELVAAAVVRHLLRCE